MKQNPRMMAKLGKMRSGKGVTPEDDALMDITLPKGTAIQFEYDVHRNLGQIRNRVIGEGPITQEDVLNYGSGKTEYTTPNAPIWNIRVRYVFHYGDLSWSFLIRLKPYAPSFFALL